MCRTAVEGQDDPLARALSASTLFLMAMPFAVAASVGGWLFYTMRRGPIPGGMSNESVEGEHVEPGSDDRE